MDHSPRYLLDRGIVTDTTARHPDHVGRQAWFIIGLEDTECFPAYVYTLTDRRADDSYQLPRFDPCPTVDDAHRWAERQISDDHRGDLWVKGGWQRFTGDDRWVPAALVETTHRVEIRTVSGMVYQPDPLTGERWRLLRDQLTRCDAVIEFSTRMPPPSPNFDQEVRVRVRAVESVIRTQVDTVVERAGQPV